MRGEVFRYNNIFRNENGVEVELELKTENLTDTNEREILGFIANSSRKFYLEVAEQLHRKKVRKMAADEIYAFAEKVYDQCVDAKMTYADFRLFALFIEKIKQSKISELSEQVEIQHLPTREAVH